MTSGLHFRFADIERRAPDGRRVQYWDDQRPSPYEDDFRASHGQTQTQQPSVWRKPYAIDFRQIPEPIFVEFEKPVFLDKSIARPVKNRIAQGLIVVPSVVRYAIEAPGVRIECARPGLGGNIRLPAVNNLCRRADAAEPPGPRGAPNATLASSSGQYLPWPAPDRSTIRSCLAIAGTFQQKHPLALRRRTERRMIHRGH